MAKKSVLTLLLVLGLGGSVWAQGRMQSTIEGRVTGPAHRAVDHAMVTLQDDGYGQLKTTYTDGAGVFRFTNIPPGSYYVLVEPNGTPFERQRQRVLVDPISLRPGAGEVFRIEFTLSSKDLPGEDHVSGPPGIVFYQTVSEDAKKEFHRGLKELQKNDFEKAVVSFKRAIEIFPDYFDALAELGDGYAQRGNFSSALPPLTHAVEVNPKAENELYFLGVSLCEMKRAPEGIQVLRRVLDLNPESVNAGMRLGIELGVHESTRSEAISVLQKVARDNGPQVPQVYLYLAALYNNTRKYSEAAQSLEAFLSITPDRPETETRRAQLKRAIQDLQQKVEAPKP